MTTTTGFISDSWAITDLDGRIEAVSSPARTILRVAHLDRGDNLLHFFPFHLKAVVFDIEVALTGWPTERTLVLRRGYAAPMTVRYHVSRRLIPDNLGLFWLLEVALGESPTRAA